MLLKVPIVIRQNYKAYYVQIHINPKQNNTQRVSLSCTDTVLKITFCTQLTYKAKKLTNPKYEL